MFLHTLLLLKDRNIWQIRQGIVSYMEYQLYFIIKELLNRINL